MKKFIAILISMLCALGSLSFVGCGQKKGGANMLQIWINKAGYGVEWVDDAFALFEEQEWVREKYPDGITYSTNNFGGATTGLDHLVGGGTQYDIVMPTGGLSAGTYLENYKQFLDLSDLYEREIPGENVKLIDKMIPNIAKETSLSIRTLDDPIRVSIPWINGAHGWFYNETTLKEYVPGITYKTMPRTTNEFIDLLDDVKAGIAASPNAGKDWAIFHHSAAVSYWTSDATVWWAQYDGVDGYENYFEGENQYNQIDEEAAALNSESEGRLEALKVLDEIINFDNGYVYGKHHEELTGYGLVLGRLAEGSQFVFTSNGDWVENETNPYKGENEVIRMMKTPVISSIVKKLTFAESTNAEKILSEMIRCIDEGMDFDNTRMAVILYGQIEESDYITVKKARNTVGRVGGHIMCIPSYSDAAELAQDFLLFLATDTGIESMMKNGIFSSYEYDYFKKEEVTNNLTQMRKDFIKIMSGARDNGTLLRNPESFPTVYYGGLKPWNTSQHPHIGACFVNSNANARLTPQELFDKCKVSQGTFSSILKASGL